MRFENYLNEKPSFLQDYLILCESLELNEMTIDTFNIIKAAGKKMGFKIKKSKSLIDYFRSAERGVEDLLRYATLFMMTDIKDNASRKELIGDAKKVFKSINKKDVAGMLMQLDKASLGLTSHIRYIFQSVFGIEISTTNYWYDDIEYIKKELRHTRKVLNKMDAKKELKALDTFETALEGIFK
jgi:hypothetical protein